MFFFGWKGTSGAAEGRGDISLEGCDTTLGFPIITKGLSLHWMG
jgi:hypothetical protein